MTIATFPIAHRGFGLIEFETDKRLLWVKNGSRCLAAGCLLCPGERTPPGCLGMSEKCRFCCKSQLRQAAKRDSVVLTRFSMGSIHDGPSEE